jgi:heptosyltransferase-2
LKSILVFRSAALGDFIMSTPALAELRKAFPSHRIVLLTIQSFDKSIMGKVAQYVGDARRLPWVELAMPHLIDEVVTLKSATDLRYLWHMRRHLREYRIEAAILITDVGAPWKGRWMKRLLLRFLIGNLPVLGWRGAGNPLQLKRKGLLKHHVHGPLQFLSELTPPRKYKDEDLAFDLRPKQDAIAWVEAWLLENRVDGKRLVALAPGSIQPHKRWPIDSFRALIELILARYADSQIIVIGTSADTELGDKLAAVEPQRIHNLAGTTSIAQSAALLQRCTLLVGNDGGAMHLGDAMGCKVVSIVPGIEFPDSIEPWHNKALAVRHPVDCSPCYNFVFCPQKHNKCMLELPVERVFAKCTSVLDQ